MRAYYVGERTKHYCPQIEYYIVHVCGRSNNTTNSISFAFCKTRVSSVFHYFGTSMDVTIRFAFSHIQFSMSELGIVCNAL